MDLQEEYYLRNKVETPLIRYNSNGSVMLECPSVSTIDQKWRVFSISVTNKEGDPGKFEMRIYNPQHNGYKNRGMLLCTNFNEKEDCCWWENYEEHLTHYCSKMMKKLKCQTVTDRTRLGLACWEILLYCYDSCVSELPFHYQEQFHKVLDEKLKADDRIKYMNDSIGLLQSLSPSSTNAKYLLQGWSSLRDYTEPKNYATWLAKLIGA